ncbi:MAG: 1-acyl-sn-glycerol-3-phosphate acyltransferase [Magnetospirillum sp.]|nr:1-acyl-sn-glycerol-3-phosphate acyltransferase [Magnetospirillum sp.]
MSSPFIALLRFLGFLLWTLAALGPYLLLLAVGWKGYSRYARGYFRVCCRLIGFQVKPRGAPQATAKPVLYVANHASYLDIIILGSLLDGCFVAKSEVAGWPGFGFLARIAQTVFVDRKRGRTAKERDQLGARLAAGDSLILFPEGTSNDGNRVLPFKSSLFAVAQMSAGGGAPLPVQPVSVAYTRLDGQAIGRALRPYYAWYGDMTLAGHLFAALGLGRLTVEVVFHPVVTVADFADRKALANHCHDVVAHGVVSALAGRLDDAKVVARRPAPRAGAETAALAGG